MALIINNNTVEEEEEEEEEEAARRCGCLGVRQSEPHECNGPKKMSTGHGRHWQPITTHVFNPTDETRTRSNDGGQKALAWPTTLIKTAAHTHCFNQDRSTAPE